MKLVRFAVLAMIALCWPGRHDLAFAAESATYPITIKHAFGTTVLEKKPERVATVAWANHEVPLALGIVPVGMARANFGDDDGDGILPWVAARLDELKAEKPVLFDEGDGIDFEAVAATRPDVILAAYSGLSQADYDTLSQIAPVIAYPEAPWSTDWRETIRLNSAGLGMAAEGQALIASIEADIAQTLGGHPELKGKTAMFITHLSSWDLSTVNFYTTNDTRVRFFADLGLASPKSVVQASQPGKFSGSVSAEEIDAFDDVDILVTYGDGMLFDALKANALMLHMPAVARDSIVMLGNNAVGNAANPTPLSISWVLKDYVKLLSEAAKKAK
ncbi:iron-siderophore ABC transporter substrate-binding protein [Ensifer adhaerens]|uniref:iron-siderophore ABC transporter substrate-binding protein n=1 Tax=Ensifer TaxID=106591 RepID=UPI000715A964|nr:MULTISPECIES: iron-siderophore ABC transporter substrate-binding protein [Ensifer]OWZ89427.1 ABC transporter substrate-binding protein [Sinorhizobium sp. LM21]KQX31592.1 ABC transporter substrate-binding protein [Ensifer sp. Root423]KQX52343.1 ABC transporter substrate-binding protein [Ensifer sp. Root1298]KQX85545.1 ABC transporter substrate-binding protein [Ensifer sp. Root1312]KQZ54244.1 ABC transporter substrate-binding protein [Ensifer sp. Root558]